MKVQLVQSDNGKLLGKEQDTVWYIKVNYPRPKGCELATAYLSNADSSPESGEEFLLS